MFDVCENSERSATADIAYINTVVAEASFLHADDPEWQKAETPQAAYIKNMGNSGCSCISRAEASYLQDL